VVRDLEGGGSSGGSFPRGGPEPSVRHEEWWKLVVRRPVEKSDASEVGACFKGFDLGGLPAAPACDTIWFVRRSWFWWVILSTTGLGTILMPDRGPRVFSVRVMGIPQLARGRGRLAYSQHLNDPAGPPHRTPCGSARKRSSARSSARRCVSWQQTECQRRVPAAR